MAVPGWWGLESQDCRRLLHPTTKSGISPVQPATFSIQMRQTREVEETKGNRHIPTFLVTLGFLLPFMCTSSTSKAVDFRFDIVAAVARCNFW